MSTATEERTIVMPFGIAADHPRNSDLLLQGIVNLRLRSRIIATRTYKDANGRVTVPLDQSRSLATFPEVPGMELHVNPAKRIYRVIDPLEGDEELCERIARWMQSGAVRTTTKVRGCPPVTGELDIHRMKTVVREMFRLVDEGAAKLVAGVLPDAESVCEMPGHFLLNPGSRIPNGQPVFEHQWEEWYQQLQKAGG